jgi:peptidyl-prolyl cis-trans isomerase D
MLQAIRSKAGSFVVKLLFFLLIVTFGIWGIGDVLLRRNTDTTVATVGGTSIRADEVQTAVRQELDRFRQLFGGSVDIQQAKALGIVDGVVQRIVTTHLVEHEADRLHLLIGDQAVANAIFANPTFQGPGGTFDRARYNAILSQNRLSEPQYEAMVRRDLERGFLTDAVTAGAAPPPLLVSTLYRTRNEKRTADGVLIKLDSVGDIPKPTDDDLAQYYEQHQEAFRVPEYRGFTLLSMTPDDLADTIEVPEAKLREEYQNRLDEFRTPERRQVEQIFVTDEDKAKQAEAALQQGKDFAEVATEVAGQDEAATKLGWVKRDDLPPELADAVFGIEQGKTSEPVHDALGWHVMRVTAIEPGTTQSFDEVKDKVKAAVAHDQAADELYKVSNEVDDALAGGASLEDVAQKFKAKLTKLDAVDPSGRDPEGKPVQIPVAQREVLRTAFDTESGQTSRLQETKDGAFYVVRVDKVDPTHVKPLADVKDKAEQLWTHDQRSAAAEKQAQDLAAEVGPDRPLEAIAKEKGLQIVPVGPVGRNGAAQANLPPVLVSRLFEAKQGAAVVGGNNDGFYVAQLKSIDQPDPEADSAGVEQLKQQLAGGVHGDVLAEYTEGLRRRFPVEIRQDEISRLF